MDRPSDARSVSSPFFEASYSEDRVPEQISIPQPIFSPYSRQNLPYIENNLPLPHLNGTNNHVHSFTGGRPVTSGRNSCCSSLENITSVLSSPSTSQPASVTTSRPSSTWDNPSTVSKTQSSSQGPERPEQKISRWITPNHLDTKLGSSTSSLVSLSSIKTVSSDSPLYFFKKTLMDLELPFDKDIDAEEIEKFMNYIKERQNGRKRSTLCQRSFKIFWLTLVLLTVYFLFVGMPLWDGVVYKIWKLAHFEVHSIWGMMAFLLWGSLVTWFPLLFCSFEKNLDDVEKRDASETCLIIPAYVSIQACWE
jgi:hypothetical protein